MMLWLQAVAPFDCFSLGPWVSAPGLVCSSQRCAFDSSSPPRLVSASAQLMNTINKQNRCHLHVFLCFFSHLAYNKLCNQAEIEQKQSYPILMKSLCTNHGSLPWPQPAGVCLWPDSAPGWSWPRLCPVHSALCGPGSVGFAVPAAWRPGYEFPYPEWTDSFPALTHGHAALMKKK